MIYSRVCVMQCHVVVHAGFLHVANYWVGSYTVWRLAPETGTVAEKVFEDKHGKGTGKVASRQAEAHAHGVYIHDGFSYVPDLGADKIWIYKVCKTHDFCIRKRVHDENCSYKSVILSVV